MPKAQVGGVAVDQLRSIIQRVEKLNEDKAAISADIKEVFAEARGNGFDVTAIKGIIKLRAKDESTREEEELILDTYRRAMGLIPELDEE